MSEHDQLSESNEAFPPRQATDLTNDKVEQTPVVEQQAETTDNQAKREPPKEQVRRDIASSSIVKRENQVLGLLMELGGQVMKGSPVYSDNVETGWEAASNSLYGQFGKYTYQGRYDPYYMHTFWYGRNNRQNWNRSRLRRHYYDTIITIPAKGRAIDNMAASVINSLTALNDDANAMKNMVANPQARSASFLSILARTGLGHVVADETAWTLRLLSMIYHCDTASPDNSHSFFRAFAARLTPLNNPQFTRARFNVPDNVDIPCYYANSNQFARALRGEADMHGIQPSEIADNWSVIPINNSAYGDWITILAMASLDSSIWNTYLGHWVFDADLGVEQAGQAEVHVREMGCARALRNIIRGPSAGVIFVLVDESGTSEATGPRPFWDGEAVPCLIVGEQPQPAVNLMHRFQTTAGNGVNEEPPEQDDFEGWWLEAWRWFCNSVITPGAERQAYDLAAEYFHRATIEPDPTDEQVQGVNNVAPERAYLGQGGGARRNRNRVRVVMPNIQGGPDNADAGGIGEEHLPVVLAAADPRPVTSGWTPQTDDLLGRQCNTVYPNNSGVPGALRNYVVDRTPGQGPVNQDIAQMSACQLMTVSPSLSLYGQGAPSLEVRYSIPVVPDGWDFAANPLSYSEIPNYQASDGVQRGSVAAPDNYARLITYFGQVNAGQVSYYNWSDARAVMNHIQKQACIAGALAQMALISSGMPMSVMLSLTYPSAKRNPTNDDMRKYDLIKYALCGSQAVAGTQSMINAAATSDLRLNARILRADAREARYKGLPTPYREAASLINNYAGQEVLPLSASNISQITTRIANATYQGFGDPRAIKDYVMVNLSANSLNITEGAGWTSVWMSGYTDELRILERTAFFPDAGRDMVMHTAETGVAPSIQMRGWFMSSNFCWTVASMEEEATNVPKLCLLVDPVVLPHGSYLYTSCQWPLKGEQSLESMTSVAEKWSSSDVNTQAYFEGGKSDASLAIGANLHSISAYGAALVTRIGSVPVG